MLNNKPANTIRMRCYECLNYLIATIHENGGISGCCPVCKATFYSKQHSAKEKHIRIIKHS